MEYISLIWPQIVYIKETVQFYCSFKLNISLQY
jgi:hypothetical protein